jgi:hypothetical protein
MGKTEFTMVEARQYLIADSARPGTTGIERGDPLDIQFLFSGFFHHDLCQ